MLKGFDLTPDTALLLKSASKSNKQLASITFRIHKLKDIPHEVPGKNTTEPQTMLPQTQRVELVAFPDKVGDDLRHIIKDSLGHDCLRFREEKLAPDMLLGESLVRCLWLNPTGPFLEPSFAGIVIAIGRNFDGVRKAELVASGFTAVIDLESESIHDAARILCAYAKQAAKDSLVIGATAAIRPPNAKQPPITLKKSDAGLKYLAAAVEMLDIGVYVIDESQNGEISVWNSEMERLFQIGKNEVIGKQIHELFNDPLVCGVFRDLSTDFSQNRAIFPSKGLSRSNFIADISKTQLHGINGQQSAIVGIIQDVTNRIHSENRLIAAFNELETSKEKLEQSNLEIRKGIEKAKKLAVVAQSSNKAKSYFLSNISHELRTPLNSIVSLTQALLEGTFGDLNAKQHENLEIVSESSKHLQSLINDILDLSKIELGKMTLKFAQAGIGDIARSSIRMIEQEASLKNVRCILEINTELENIEVDAKRLRQILLNLLVNAVKFTKSNTDVTLQIEENSENESVVFNVIDHGIGIDQNDFSKIFSPFTQLDDSLSRHYEGTGLGLAIASKFVELHGGGLRVASTPDLGSTFTISLPIEQTKDEEEPELKSNLAEIALNPKASQRLILILDENERSALRIKSQVSRISRLSPVITLPNEISAYHDQIAPKAIFVDVNIMNAHGTEWILQAKRLPAWKKTKWIAIGSLDLPENHSAAARLGFNACSCKPISNILLAKFLR
ncbi:ATPase, histidine kinase-, DNA gyrase B-, and HSP90-like domain protein [Verrucomicrobiia bacterium DG1235]|nr:ATPase, histidine kinase-, DNA gyrase B-, and HSP90-like domain protein [Verrucomicrobiae bacterium DG1235]